MATKKSALLNPDLHAKANAILDSSGSSHNVPPDIKALIKESRQELSSVLQITRADIIDGISDAIAMAKLAADPTAMIRGWSEIAKMLGLYAPEVKKVELSMHMGRLSKYEAMTDDELMAIAEGRTIPGECVEVSGGTVQ